jgi:hypothetical protein
MELDDPATAHSKQRQNPWKIAFFVALFACEIMREITVLITLPSATPSTDAFFYSQEGYVQAMGSWKRIDGGERLAASTVTIECNRNSGRCLEASVRIDRQNVYAPDLAWFDAKFSLDAVSYENDWPACVRYSVRLDLNMKKALAVRERKENPTNANCAKSERRIEMQLGDGYDPTRDSLNGHFVPLLRAILGIAKLLTV